MQDHDKIVLEIGRLEPLVAKYRRQQKKVVLTQGVFDMVHIGHARYCQKASEYGDVLIVGVDSDAKVRSRKGPDRPIVPQAERMEMLTYLSSVDAVVLKELEQPKYSLIKAVQPDVLIATRDRYTKKDIEELKQWCKEVIVLEPMATTSTSAKIRLLQIGAAKKISATLSKKLIDTIEGVLEELKSDVDVANQGQKTLAKEKNTL